MWHLTLLGDEIGFFRDGQRESIKVSSIKARLLLARVALEPMIQAAMKTPNDWEGRVETLLASPVKTTALLPVMWIPNDYDEATRREEMSGMRTDWNGLLGDKIIASQRESAGSRYWLDSRLIRVDAHKFLQHPLQSTTSLDQITQLLDCYDETIGMTNSNRIVLRNYADYRDGDVAWISTVESFFQEVYLAGVARLAQENPLSVDNLSNRLEKFEARGVTDKNTDLLKQVQQKLATCWPSNSPSGKTLLDSKFAQPTLTESTESVADEAKSAHLNRVTINLDGASFSSLSEAIGNAVSGDVLYLQPGIYEESVVIDKALRLRGAEKRGDVILQARGATPLTFRAPSDDAAGDTVGGTGIFNVTVRQLGRRKACGVAIESGNPSIEKCEISAEGTACIKISEAATASILDNNICQGRGPGVLICPGASGTLIDNNIYGNKEAGVEILSALHAARTERSVLIRNSICNNAGDGVLIRDYAQAYLEGNSIYGNRFAGISIRDYANPLVGKDNSIHRNLSDGIFASENGRGTIEDSTIANNIASGVSIKTGARLILRGNKIKEGRRNGVYIHESGAATLERNDLSRNCGSGLIVRQESQVFLFDNHFEHNQESGFLVKENSTATLVEETNTFESNHLGDSQIESESVAQTVAKSKVSGDH